MHRRPLAIRTILLTALIATAAGARVVAQDSSPSVSPNANPKPIAVDANRVRELIERLGSDRLSERRAAERGILGIGPSVLEVLPPFEEIRDAAVRQTLSRLSLELERQLAQSHVKASRVNFEGTATLGKLVQTIRQQTGNSLDLSQVPADRREQPLTVHWNDRPFWSAVDDLQSTTQLLLTRSSSRSALGLAAPSDETSTEILSAPVTFDVNEAFRIELVSLSKRRGLSDDPLPRDLLRLTFRLRAEPRLRPLFAEYRDAAMVVTIDETPLSPFNPGASHQPDFTGRDELLFSIDYLVPPEARLDDLHVTGRVDVEVAAVPREIRFSSLDSPFPISQRRGGVRVSLKDVHPLPPTPALANSTATNAAEFLLDIRYDRGGPAFESYRLPALHREAWLESPEGVPVAASHSLETRGERDGALSMAHRFEGLPPNWRQGRLVYEAATAILSVPVSFEFQVPSSR